MRIDDPVDGGPESRCRESAGLNAAWMRAILAQGDVSPSPTSWQKKDPEAWDRFWVKEVPR
jgi:hypothetical protein